ncbi:MAG: hypothetical protein ACE5IR_06890 [bacterium]
MKATDTFTLTRRKTAAITHLRTGAGLFDAAKRSADWLKKWATETWF